MELLEYLKRMEKIQEKLIEFIESEDQEIDFTDNVKNLLIQENIKFELKEFLHLTLEISNNYHHKTNLYNKIEQVLSIFKSEIQNYYSNLEIFTLFQNNKRILLFFFEEKIIIPEKAIYNIIKNNKYLQYFYPELKSFLNESEIQNLREIQNLCENDFDMFEKKRKIGENDLHICYLIRNDLVQDFVSFVNMSNYPLKSKINQSFYETNSFLISRCPSLIEYSAFYGSIQIFKYLMMNNVPLTESLWIYAIHSNNQELFHVLEENKIKMDKKICKKCIYESIKCHHNDFTNYIKENLLSKEQSEEDLNDLLNSLNDDLVQEESYDEFDMFCKCLKYFNYSYFNPDFINDSLLYKLCKYDYCNIVKILMKSNHFNVNTIKIINVSYL